MASKIDSNLKPNDRFNVSFSQKVRVEKYLKKQKCAENKICFLNYNQMVCSHDCLSNQIKHEWCWIRHLCFVFFFFFVKVLLNAVCSCLIKTINKMEQERSQTKKPTVCIVIGMAGSGKTTLMQVWKNGFFKVLNFDWSSVFFDWSNKFISIQCILNLVCLLQFTNKIWTSMFFIQFVLYYFNQQTK